jgi:hypothetical protein
MKIEKFHQTNIQLMKNRFADQGRIPSMMLAVTLDNRMIACARQFENSKEKAWVYDMYSVILFVKDATMYSFLSEMWFSVQKPGPFVAPSDQSDRKEGLFIVTRDIKGNALYKSFEIERDKIGARLIKTQFDDGEAVDGINLFKRLGPNRDLPMDTIRAEYEKIDKASWYSEFEVDDENYQ